MKKTRGKKQKSLQRLKKDLWKAFSEYIRQRDRGICISCDKQQNWKDCHAGHYFPRTTGLALFFDERNVNCQCAGCNTFRHGNLAAYAIALRKKYGEGILEELDAKRRQFKKYTRAEYETLIEKYKKCDSESI